MTLLVNIADWTNLDYLLANLRGNAAVHAMLWLLILLCLVEGAVCFFFTNYILKKHLNLE